MIPTSILRPAAAPLACTLDAGARTGRLAEFTELFDQALVARDRTVAGIRFRFAAQPGVEATVRDLARREQQCCGFFSFTVTTAGGEVLWDAAVDDPAARPLLDELLDLPGEHTSASTVVPPASPQRVRSWLAPIAALLACGLACSIPVLLAAVAGTAGLSAAGAPVWITAGVCVGAGGLLLGLRHRRRAASSATECGTGACGC